MRQIRKQKCSKLMHTYVWEPHAHERVRDPTCRRGREIEREHGYIDILSCG